MASSDEIRAVFADPQVDGMDAFYKVIGWFLKDGADFRVLMVRTTGGGRSMAR